MNGQTAIFHGDNGEPEEGWPPIRHAYDAAGSSGPVAEEPEPEDRGLTPEAVERSYPQLATPCPICRAPAVQGDVTGHLYQLRCRACGWTFEVVR